MSDELELKTERHPRQAPEGASAGIANGTANGDPRSPLRSGGDDATGAVAAFEKPATPTIGEKWWHRLTYTGVGYLLNVAISIAIWDYFISAGGKPVFHGLKRATGNEGLSKFFFSSLGGHVAVLGGVKPLEDRAGYITHKFNQWLNKDYQHKDAEFPAGTPDEDYPMLANSPNKNTFMQVVARRAMGQGAVIGSGMGLRALQIEKPIEESAARMFRAAAEGTGIHAVQKLARLPLMQRYSKLLGLEATLTIVTAAVTAFTKNTFGKSRDDVSDDALSVDIPGITEDDPPRPRAAARFKPAASHVAAVKSHENGEALSLQP